MPLTQKKFRVVKLCKKCGGAGFKVKTANPLRFKICTKCNGRGGRVASPLT